MDPTVELRFEGILGIAMLAQQHSMVETQAIEQILVAKGVCTAEEIQSMRNVVFRSSPKVKKLTHDIDEITETIDKLTKQIEDKAKFGKIMSDALDGKELTSEEKIYLYNSLYPENIEKGDNENND